MSKVQHNIARCSSEKPCPKCGSIYDTIVINKDTGYSLYCSDCGSFVKNASVTDKYYMYGIRITVHTDTPKKVISRIIESEKSMFR